MQSSFNKTKKPCLFLPSPILLPASGQVLHVTHGYPDPVAGSHLGLLLTACLSLLKTYIGWTKMQSLKLGFPHFWKERTTSKNPLSARLEELLGCWRRASLLPISQADVSSLEINGKWTHNLGSKWDFSLSLYILLAYQKCLKVASCSYVHISNYILQLNSFTKWDRHPGTTPSQLAVELSVSFAFLMNWEITAVSIEQPKQHELPSLWKNVFICFALSICSGRPFTWTEKENLLPRCQQRQHNSVTPTALDLLTLLAAQKAPSSLCAFHFFPTRFPLGVSTKKSWLFRTS